MPVSSGKFMRTKIHDLVPQHSKLFDQNRLDTPRFPTRMALLSLLNRYARMTL